MNTTQLKAAIDWWDRFDLNLLEKILIAKEQAPIAAQKYTQGVDAFDA
jgi:hypothetical protein